MNTSNMNNATPANETLRDFIEHNNSRTMHETLQLMTPVMKTLEHMHKNKVIHGGVSPDSLEVLSDGHLELLDPDKEDRWRDITLTKLVDKASYSAPESLDTKGISGSWSDVYSVCAVMYFCVTGVDPRDAVSRMLLDDLKLPSELGADIRSAAEGILMKGLDLDSTKRLRSITQLRLGLEKAVINQKI